MGSNGKQMHTSQSSTNTLWYGKFYEGCHRHMGDQPQPDRAISIAELLLVLDNLNTKYLITEREQQLKAKTYLACTGVFVATGFLGGLRGEEVLLMELSSIRKHFEDGLGWDPPHILLPLLGRFKGKTGERCFLLAVVLETTMGINLQLWMKRMITCHESAHKRNGWVFPNAFRKGHATIADYNPAFHEALRDVQAGQPDLIKAKVDIESTFSLR